jgi:predicted transcriptional regulator
MWREALEVLSSSEELSAAVQDLPGREDGRLQQIDLSEVVQGVRDATLSRIRTQELEEAARDILSLLLGMQLPFGVRGRATKLLDALHHYIMVRERFEAIITRPAAESAAAVQDLSALVQDDLGGMLDLDLPEQAGAAIPQRYWRLLLRRRRTEPMNRLTLINRRATLTVAIQNRLDKLASVYGSARAALIDQLVESAAERREFQALQLRWDAARKRALSEIQDGMLAGVRSEVARRLGETYELRMTQLPVGSLVRTGDPNRTPFPTDVYLRLDWLISRRDRASIGLSGPRGAGKSTLIRYACFAQRRPSEPRDEQEDHKPRLGLILSAPTAYEPKEFIQLLHQRLCRAILGSPQDRPPIPNRATAPWDPFMKREESWAVAAGLGAAGLTLAVLASLAMFRHLPDHLTFVGRSLILVALPGLALGAARTARVRRRWPAHLAYVEMLRSLPEVRRYDEGPLLGVSPSAWWAFRTSAVATGVGFVLSIAGSGFRSTVPWLVTLCLIGGAAILAPVSRRAAFPVQMQFDRSSEDPSADYRISPVHAEGHGRLQDLAAEQLEKLSYTTSYSADSSATLKAGSTSSIPLGLEAKQGRGTTVQPSAVTYPEIVHRLRTLLAATAELYELVIGIDELDKMRNASDVEAFLNEVKTIFDIPGCYFLVSVSEDAAAGFERRGVTFRDVFDSSFDDVLTLPFLTFAESRELLYSAAGRWTTPLVMLCHVMSGGLPRDLLRMARQVVELAEQDGGIIDVAVAARHLVWQDLSNRCHAVRHELRKLGSSAARDLYSRVPVWPSDCLDPALLHEEMERLRIVDNSGSERAQTADPDPDAVAVDAFADELAAAHFFGAQLLAFLSAYTMERMKGAEAGQVDALADARRDLGLDPGLATSRIAEFGRLGLAPVAVV